jgi:hypothetical protein
MVKLWFAGERLASAATGDGGEDHKLGFEELEIGRVLKEGE